jgi:hypothetical protein
MPAFGDPTLRQPLRRAGDRPRPARPLRRRRKDLGRTPSAFPGTSGSHQLTRRPPPGQPSCASIPRRCEFSSTGSIRPDRLGPLRRPAGARATRSWADPRSRTRGARRIRPSAGTLAADHERPPPERWTACDGVVNLRERRSTAAHRSGEGPIRESRLLGTRTCSRASKRRRPSRASSSAVRDRVLRRPRGADRRRGVGAGEGFTARSRSTGRRRNGRPRTSSTGW